MSFMALLLALMLEQVRPLSEGNWAHDLLRQWSLGVRHFFDTGRKHQAMLIWALAMGVPVLGVLLVHWVLMAWLGWPFAMAWSIAVLYVTLGFRQFSHHFTDIRDALEAGEEQQARTLLAQWLQVDATTLPRHELVRHVIECSAIAAHRHVFGVMTWFSVLAAIGLGPVGAVIYRLGGELPRWWVATGMQNVSTRPEQDLALDDWAQQAWRRIDWVSARVTAVTFAIVGNFEEAIDCWRNHAQSFPDDNDGVVLAATSGAINVRLGGETLRPAQEVPDAEPPLAQPSTPGMEPHMVHLRSMVGLVWRSVVMWLVLLFLLTLSRLLG
ncbi:MAG: CobD/CbiB family protein [Alphaproteobacteria bacterium]|nr:CobD/CbiB family protein [Alphaproteobacteria bacterium]